MCPNGDATLRYVPWCSPTPDASTTRQCICIWSSEWCSACWPGSGAQGFIYHDLSRACLAQSRDSVPRVVLLGRLSLYGRGAERLHEEIVPVAARWRDPQRRSGPLVAYAKDAETHTLDLLEASLEQARVPNDTIQRKLLEAAAQDIEELRPQLAPRAAVHADAHDSS